MTSLNGRPKRRGSRCHDDRSRDWRRRRRSCHGHGGQPRNPTATTVVCQRIAALDVSAFSLRRPTPTRRFPSRRRLRLFSTSRRHSPRDRHRPANAFRRQHVLNNNRSTKTPLYLRVLWCKSVSHLPLSYFRPVEDGPSDRAPVELPDANDLDPAGPDGFIISRHPSPRQLRYRIFSNLQVSSTARDERCPDPEPPCRWKKWPRRLLNCRNTRTGGSTSSINR